MEEEVDLEPEQPRKSLFKRLWWVVPLIIIILLAGFVFSKTMLKKDKAVNPDKKVLNPLEKDNSGDPDKKIASTRSNCTTKAAPDPATDNITWTLPDCASDLRLTFPYTMDEVYYNADAQITGYGVHAGEHIEGLNHEWLHVKSGTPIRSWADGTVEKVEVSGDVAAGEIQITINYGHNTMGVHMEVGKSLVKVGDKVTAGQPIAEGWTKEAGGDVSAEYAFLDLNRDDGIVDFGQTPSTASPYDYLKEPDKSILIAAFKKHYLEPALAGKKLNYLYQPYLTNQLLLHTSDKKDKFSGEWYGTKTNSQGDWQDCLTFIEANNPYYKGNVVLSRNNNLPDPYSGLQGTFEVDYAKNQIKITPDDSPTGGDIKQSHTINYGIFKIDESGSRPTLKIEYQPNTYPTSFSDKALSYVLRDNGMSKSQGGNQ